MSEEILKALTELFGIITKQDGGATEIERKFVMGYFNEQLDQETSKKYTTLYDQISDYGNKGPERISVREAVRIQKFCREINKTLTLKQKVIIIVKLLELVASDGNFSAQRKEIINTVSETFNFDIDNYRIIQSFVLEKESTLINSEDILCVSKRTLHEETDKKKHKFVDTLEGEILVLWAKSADMYFLKILGMEGVILNGSAVKPGQVYLIPNGSVLKKDSYALFYSDITDIFLETSRSNKLSFVAKKLEFKFPNGVLGLRDIDIQESQGKLVGIMGGSGAGKTTLLNVLSGIEKPSGGEVLINGINIHKEGDRITGVIGYVAQDDLLIEELTVYQNLYYNAKLCFNNLNETETDQLVMSVLASLGLDHIKDIKVGNVLNKKISGGQRKRLNIALELIREPAIMFVDEPTSGLSSRDSENVIDLLKELSTKGKLIFVVIHQPSLDIYRMFDRMVILDRGGYQIYYGNPIEAFSYFKRTSKQIDDKGYSTPEQIFNIIEEQVVNEYGQYTNKRKMNPEDWNSSFQAHFKIEKVESITEQPPSSLKLPNLFKQTYLFSVRDFLTKVSNTQYMLINLLEAPLLALLLSYVIRFQNDPILENTYTFIYNDNIPAYILICIIISLFMGLTISAEEIIKDKKIQKREAFLDLSRASYLLSKLIILFTLSAIQSYTFVLIGNSILEIKGELLSYWLVLFTASCFANVLGLNISATFNSVVTIYITIPLLLIPQMILSGLIFKYDKMNTTISEKGTVPVLADFMVSRWAFEAITVNHYKTNEYQQYYYDIDKTESEVSSKRKYWKDEMQKRIDNVLKNYQSKTKNDSINKLLKNSLLVLKNELKSNTKYKKYIKGIDIEKDLTVKHFSQEVADKLNNYLDKIDVELGEEEKKVSKKKSKIDDHFNKIKDHKKIHEEYANEELENLVKAKSVLANRPTPIVEHNGRLVQRIDPIFTDPQEPEHFLDYRADFLVPTKHFAGMYFDTYNYNLVVIWFLTVLLYITLYFEFFKKLLNFIPQVGSNFVELFNKYFKKNKPVAE